MTNFRRRQSIAIGDLVERPVVTDRYLIRQRFKNEGYWNTRAPSKIVHLGQSPHSTPQFYKWGPYEGDSSSVAPPEYNQRALPPGPGPGSPGRYTSQPVWFKPMPGKGGFGKRGGLVQMPISPGFVAKRAARLLLELAVKRIAPKLVPGLNVASALLDAYSVAFQPGQWSNEGPFAFGTYVFEPDWTLKCSLPTNIRAGEVSNINPGLACSLTNSDVTVGAFQIPTATTRWVAVGNVNNLLPPAMRMAHAIQWTGPAVHTIPKYVRGFPNDPFFDDGFPTANPFDPLPKPLHQPAFPPQVGYKDLPLLRLSPNNEIVAPSGGAKPPLLGGPGLPPPSYRPPATGEGPGHYVRRPRKGEKERKHDPHGKFHRVIKKLVDPLTEFNDLVDAAYDALPARYRKGRGKKTMQEKLVALYRHARQIDMAKFVRNLIQNEVTDRVFGSFGKAIAKGTRKNPYWVSPVGPQAGSRYRPGVPQKYLK